MALLRMRKNSDTMKSTGTFVSISTLVVLFSVATTSEVGQLESVCNSDTDCASPLICLGRQCETNYCLLYSSRVEHETCTPVLGGYYAACNYGYEYINDTCAPIQSSAIGFEGNNCTTSQDCLTSLQCEYDQCVDPCKYYRDEPHVDCKTVHHEAEFTCHPGYTADSYLKYECHQDPKRKCESNSDCPSSQICDSHHNCTNPCLDSVTPFTNGDCTVKDNKMQIACHAGHEPIPCGFTCEKIIANHNGSEGAQCSTSTDCVSTLACSNAQCADPCKEWSSADRPHCVVVNHIGRHTEQCNRTSTLDSN